MRRLIWVLLIVIVSLVFSGCDRDDPEPRGQSSEEKTELEAAKNFEQTNVRIDALDRKIRILQKQVSKLEREQESSFLGTIFSYLFTILLAVAGFFLVRRFRKQIWPVLEPMLQRFKAENVGEATAGESGKADEDLDKMEKPDGFAKPAAQPQRGQPDGGTARQPAKVEPRSTTPAPRRIFDKDESGQNTSDANSSEARENKDEKADAPAPLYASSPVNGLFMPNRLEHRPENFTYYVILPDADGRTASLNLVEDATLQQQILDSQASHSEVIEFERGGDGQKSYMASLTPGKLVKTGDAWKITERIRIVLR